MTPDGDSVGVVPARSLTRHLELTHGEYVGVGIALGGAGSRCHPACDLTENRHRSVRDSRRHRRPAGYRRFLDSRRTDGEQRQAGFPISALFGLKHGIIDQSEYSFLVATVIGSAVIPTLIANPFVMPKHHLRRREDQEVPTRVAAPSSTPPD